MNLYLYIPPGSAHPRSMLRGLVFGRLRAYLLQNTDEDNFIHFAKLLAQRLRARGWSNQTLLPLFREAMQHLQQNHRRQPKTTTSNRDRVYFHLPYHPRGLQRRQVRQLFERHMRQILPTAQLTIAMSRPKNLRDRVCAAVLQDVPGNNPSDYLPGGDRSLPASFAQGAS